LLPATVGYTPFVAGTGEDGSVATVKSLWESVQGDPVFMRRINGWLTIFWVAMIPVSLITHWVSSVVYVSALSLWALVSGHWSAWQAARVEVNQRDEALKRAEEDMAADVVAKIVEETELSRVGTSSGPGEYQGGSEPQPATA
jgi:hypothetical protein